MAWDGDTHIKLASCYGCVVSWSPVWLEKEFSLRTELVTPKSLFHEMSSSYSVFSFGVGVGGGGRGSCQKKRTLRERETGGVIKSGQKTINFAGLFVTRLDPDHGSEGAKL